MGLLSNIAGRIERAFAGDKDQVIIRAAQGATAPIAPTGYNLLQAYGYDVLADYLRLDTSLLERYADYESMNEYATLASALDIFADDTTQTSSVNNRVAWASSSNVRVKTEVDNMLRRLDIDEEAWSIARSLVHMGNDFEELLVNEDGVIGLNHLPAPSVRRIEGRHGELYGFIQDPRGKIGFSVDDFKAAMAKRQALITGDIKAGEAGTDPTVAFEGWEVVHFRLRGSQRRSVYGISVLDSARWIWRRLMLMEDAAMIYRLHRAPERFAFYVNTGDRSDQEAMLYMNRMRQSFTKNKYVNPRTGNLDHKVGAQGSDENFYIPFRTGEEGSRVEVLGAPAWQCLVGETKIPLVDGTSPTIQELAAKGGDFWVYSIDAAGRVVPGRGYAARQTHAAAEIWEVTLDNGEVVRCTGNHPFLSRDGKWILAENLRAHDSLMPLYRRESSPSTGAEITGYEQVYDPATESWVYTHQTHSWNSPTRHPKHRMMIVARMADTVLRADKAKLLADWNLSQDHKDHSTGSRNPRWRDLDVAGLSYLVLATGARNIKELMKNGRVARSVIARVLQTEGLTWNGFAQRNIPNWEPRGRARCATNHKVVTVRNTGELAPVYDITVETHANFAVAQGVFVSNSVDDVEYFNTKLFAAIKIPRAYLGDADGAVRGVVSGQDIRFARVILRIQREVRNGFKKMARVHLSALNIDPNSVEFDIEMTIPSALLEIAQIEARAARADLASRMRDFVSLHWVLEHVFNLSDDEIQTIFLQRDEDMIREGKAQGEAQAAAQPPMDTGMGGEPGMDAELEAGTMAPTDASVSGDASSTPGPFESRKQAQPLFSARRIGVEFPSGRRLRGTTKPITERELFADSNKESQKRVEGKLEELLKGDQALASRLKDLGGLLSDLKSSVTSRKR